MKKKNDVAVQPQNDEKCQIQANCLCNPFGLCNISCTGKTQFFEMKRKACTLYILLKYLQYFHHKSFHYGFGQKSGLMFTQTLSLCFFSSKSLLSLDSSLFFWEILLMWWTAFWIPCVYNVKTSLNKMDAKDIFCLVNMEGEKAASQVCH